MIKPFIAASSYLNAAPLWYSFLYGEQKSHCTLVSDVAPVRCAQLLAERRAEAALIPVIEYQRQADLLIAPGDARRVDFRAARREGIAHAEELAAIYSEQLGLPKNDLVSYLTKNIHYDLDDESLKGLQLYYELAYECGLIAEARPLIFCE